MNSLPLSDLILVSFSALMTIAMVICAQYNTSTTPDDEDSEFPTNEEGTDPKTEQRKALTDLREIYG